MSRVQSTDTEYGEQLPCGVLFPLKGIYPSAKGNALDRVQQFCGMLMTFILRTHGPYVRTGWVNARLCRVRFCVICLILLIMEIGGFYVEIIDI